MHRSSLIAQATRKIPRSPTWPWPPAPDRSRPARPLAASAWQSTTSCYASKRNWGTERSSQVPPHSREQDSYQGTRRPGDHANRDSRRPLSRFLGTLVPWYLGPLVPWSHEGTTDCPRNILVKSRAIEHSIPVVVAPSTSQRLERTSPWAWELSHTIAGGRVGGVGALRGGRSSGLPQLPGSLWSLCSAQPSSKSTASNVKQPGWNSENVPWKLRTTSCATRSACSTRPSTSRSWPASNWAWSNRARSLCSSCNRPPALRSGALRQMIEASGLRPMVRESVPHHTTWSNARPHPARGGQDGCGTPSAAASPAGHSPQRGR